MLPERFAVADIDGTLCIAWTSTDYSNPEIVTNYWPTVASTLRALDMFFYPEERANREEWPKLIAKLECVQSMPGEYFVGIRQNNSTCWQHGFHVRLIDGPRTMPVKTDVRPAPIPKSRCEIYWSGGNWIKRTAKKVEKINPLTI